MRRLEGGERERHLRAKGTQPSSPGRARAASPATRSRPRSDHGQMPKGKDAALARRKARGAPQVHLIRPEQSGHPARSNPGIAPCRRADPLA